MMGVNRKKKCDWVRAKQSRETEKARPVEGKEDKSNNELKNRRKARNEKPNKKERMIGEEERKMDEKRTGGRIRKSKKKQHKTKWLKGKERKRWKKEINRMTGIRKWNKR